MSEENTKENFRKDLNRVNYELLLIHNFLDFNDFSSDVYKLSKLKLIEMMSCIKTICDILAGDLNNGWGI
jgi:hypothetical protein